MKICEKLKRIKTSFCDVFKLFGNGSYMKRGFARMFQVSTNLSSHVLYTVLAVRYFFYLINLK